MSVKYEGKYGGYVHRLDSGRFIVGIYRWWAAAADVCTRNPPRGDVGERRLRAEPLWPPMVAQTFEQLAADGAPTYANSSAAIKAARRVYPVLAMRYPWRRCQGATL